MTPGCCYVCTFLRGAFLPFRLILGYHTLMRTTCLIVGAGPVGLLLGNLLGKQGVDTVIVDKKAGPSSHSRAIGITPPSLEILSTLGLDSAFIAEGVSITSAFVHGPKNLLGSLAFNGIPSAYRFILSFPQKRTEELLIECLDEYPPVELLWKHECVGYTATNTSVTARLVYREDGSETEIEADYLCACDGFRSTIRSAAGLPFPGRTWGDTFLMGDYLDDSGLGGEAHLFFTPDGSVESFPLPGNARRWVIQTEGLVEEPEPGFLEERVLHRAGYRLDPEDQSWQSSFRINSFILRRFVAGRVIFAGDAAHTIPPIGGQGMNTGLADAELLSAALTLLSDGTGSRRLLNEYERRRRKAARAAARRSILSMKTGTVRGRIGSALRNGALRVLLASGLRNILARHYAMLSIPHRNLKAEPGSAFSPPP